MKILSFAKMSRLGLFIMFLCYLIKVDGFYLPTATTLKEEEEFIQTGLKLSALMDEACKFTESTFGQLQKSQAVPEKLNLLLYGDGNYTSHSLPTAADAIFSSPYFSISKKTYLYSHGYADPTGHNSQKVFRMAAAIRSKGHNFIAVDATAFISFVVYPYSAGMGKHVGDMLGSFMVAMHNKGVTADKWHLVGHSMGSHISAYASRKYFQQFGAKPPRLTALDPARPCFALDVALKPDDAVYVDVMYTSLLSYRETSLGHAQYYVNNRNQRQPGCGPKLPMNEDCSHVRAIVLYVESVENDNAFMAKKCSNITTYQCNLFDVSIMGYASVSTTRGNYLTYTRAESPYSLGLYSLIY